MPLSHPIAMPASKRRSHRIGVPHTLFQEMILTRFWGVAIFSYL
jgi:hypothetical protein